jgi:uncharacterized phiE125 gp8 family phage protein
MNSILTVTVAPTETDLTTVERVKLELRIDVSTYDDLLQTKIEEATSDIESHTGRTFCRATLSERFLGAGCLQELLLTRYPVPSVTSVTVDGVALQVSEYLIDTDKGILYRLDASGYDIGWTWCRDIVVVYVGGYLMPGVSGRNLPPALEAGAVDLVQSFWFSRGRDPMVKAVDVPGVMSEQYWVGAVGEGGELPASVQEKVMPFRRVNI